MPSFVQWLRWLLPTLLLLLLPIGIGINLRGFRSTPSQPQQDSRPGSTPVRELDLQGRSTAREAPPSIPDVVPAARTAPRGEPGSSHATPLVKDDDLKPTGGRTIAGSRNGPIVISKVTPALVRSPIYKLTSGPQKDFTPRNWLEIEVEFATRQRVPEISTFRFEVSLNNSLLTGDIAVAPLEPGQGLLTVAYVSPHSLRLVSRGREAEFSNLQIKVTIVSKDGTVSEAVYVKGNRSGSIKQELDGTVRAKRDTPFAPLYWDHYVEPAMAPQSETGIQSAVAN